MNTSEILTISISGLSLVVSIIALIRDFCTRAKVQELTNLEIEKLKAEKEQKLKASIVAYLNAETLTIENRGDATARNIRHEGWDDYCGNIANKIQDTLPPHSKQTIDLYLTETSSSANIMILWDDDFATDRKFSQNIRV